MIYEYKCKKCGERFEFDKFSVMVADELGGGLAAHWVGGSPEDIKVAPILVDTGFSPPFCGPLKRVYSFGICWPKENRGH